MQEFFERDEISVIAGQRCLERQAQDMKQIAAFLGTIGLRGSLVLVGEGEGGLLFVC